MMSTQERLRVPDADDMSTDTFAKHFTLRHGDSLGGLSWLDPAISKYVEGLYRAFHARLHAIRVDLGHDHATPYDTEEQ
jgi:hypothetical protein